MSEINSENCTHDCSTCGQACADRTSPQSFLEEQNEYSDVRRVIGVVSGKGGVGKSLVTALLAAGLAKRSYDTAVLDADVTGPSMPRVFGITDKALGNETTIFPVTSAGGTKLMSVNLLLPNDEDPVVWRGPVIAGAVKQFWTDVAWGHVDFMFVDMPPGTGDVPLTVFQSLPVDGIIIVTSPQELVSMIVGKAVKMAQLMNIPVLGIVENMAYFECPDNGKQYAVFGESHVDEVAKKHQIPMTAKLPIDPEIAKACDEGRIELYRTEALDALLDRIEKML